MSSTIWRLVAICVVLLFIILLDINQVQAAGQRRNKSLHNKNHESTIRNTILPKFKANSKQLIQGNHTSNVAVIVSSSRYWFNYRHVTNALSIYHLLKRGGMTDDNIILMLADDIPCNMRNKYRGKIFPRGVDNIDLMEGVEIDYTGTDVTVDAFMRVLLGRHLPGEQASSTNTKTTGGGKRSWPKIDQNTNVLVYLTGHGGDNFFKFQDGEELMSNDIANAFSQMHEMKRYNEILFISDTCQAFTMADEIKVPNVFSVGSSLKNQNSYASHSDIDVGQSVIDRYSKVIKDFVDDAVTLTSDSKSIENKLQPIDETTVAVMERINLHDMLVRIPMNHGDLGPNSKVGHTDYTCSRRMNKVPLSDFFAAPQTARKSLMGKQASVKSSLWMSELPSVDVNEDAEQSNPNSEQECKVDGNIKRQRTNEKQKDKSKRQGMSPSDPLFLFFVACFLVCIHLSSRVI